jgi:predicted dehydrogenase
MHLLVCGLGSIGRRHLRHFRALGVARIDAFRTGKATLSDEGQPAPDRVFDDLGRALAERPDAVIVANPTSLHVATALAAVRAGRHVLVEKPLAHDLAGVDELAAEARARGVVVAVGQNLRFHPTLRFVRERIEGGELGEPLVARAHFGAYLPDWHPWEDYRASYAARRDLGGGALLTHVHEIDYCAWLFGRPDRAVGLAMGRRPLGTDVDEASALVVRHDGGTLTSITLSLAQKPPTRTLDVAFARGNLACDLLTGRWSVRHADGRVEDGAPALDLDGTYREQAQAFLRAVRGEAPPSVAIEEAAHILRIALSARG